MFTNMINRVYPVVWMVFIQYFHSFPSPQLGERGGVRGEIRGLGKRTTAFVLKRKVCRWEEAAERGVKRKS